MLDAQQEHLWSIRDDETQTTSKSHTDSFPHGKRFPWETLCATSLQEILSVEKACKDIVSDLSRHMLQYVEFDDLINSPVSVDTSVILQNVQGRSPFKQKLRNYWMNMRIYSVAQFEKNLRSSIPLWSNWFQTKHGRRQQKTKRRSRPCSTVKQEEMLKQVNKLVELGVVQQSQAPNYSQVHMVPKKSNGWRFALDYRQLNLST